MRSGAFAVMAAGAAMAVALCASPASATIYGQQYVGVVTSGVDLYGLFGPSGANLAGDSYVATFTIDTTKGSYTHDPGYASVTGGSNYGSSNPVTAVLTINGVSYTLGTTEYANGSATEEAFDTPSYTRGDVIGSTGEFFANGGNDNLYQEVYSDTSVAGYPTQFGSYDLVGQRNATSNEFVYRPTGTSTYFEYVHLDVTSATPEPSAWALLMLGVGGIGLMLRRAKRTAGARWRDGLAAC
jgi:hypothetical protein